MCLFSTPAAPKPDKTPAAPVRRSASPTTQLFRNRNQMARGTVGNIFTSPLGTAGQPSTSATRLGGTSAMQAPA